MKPLPHLPELRIVETECLQPHEHIDPARIVPLKQALEAQGVLRNPPIVLRMSDEDERYLVLDGANRTTAFRELGIPCILVQVVHFGSESLKLRTWNRVVYGVASSRFFDRVSSMMETIPLPRERRARLEAISSGDRLAYLSLPDGSAWSLGPERERLLRRVERLHKLLAAIEDIGQSERTGEIEASMLAETYPDLAGLVAFPAFEIEEVIEAAKVGVCLPSGLTRFIISPRALRVNYPLAKLSSTEAREAKQRELDAWLQERLQQRRVRYYAEATFLFDE